jgi:predicted nucleic acid-binding Zn ribbon protein
MMDRPFPFREQRPRRSARTSREIALAQWRRWDWSAQETASRRSEKSAAELMPRLLTNLRIDRRQSETEILRVWNNLIDSNITAHAQPTGIRKGTLFVTVDSSVWLDEIVRYRRREILERLQNSFGRDLISRISFRVG